MNEAIESLAARAEAAERRVAELEAREAYFDMCDLEQFQAHERLKHERTALIRKNEKLKRRAEAAERENERLRQALHDLSLKSGSATNY